MQRLGGLDAALLSMETPAVHLHVAAVAVLDRAMSPRAWSFGCLRDLVSTRVHLAPVFRRRLMEVPYGLGRPVWVDDPDFDIDDHVRRVLLAAPGGDHQLAEAVGEIMSRPLDRARPLWELHVVEGLAGGRAAVVAKAHHAAVDGASGAAVLLSLLDPLPEPPVVDRDENSWGPPPLPTGAEMLSDAVASAGIEQVAATAAIVRRSLDAVVQLRRRRRLDVERPPALFSAPRTRLNVTVTPERRVCFAEVSLDRVKVVKDAFAVTVNDVVLAMCAGALRASVAAQPEPELGGATPAADLVALVPASLRSTDGEQECGGNRLAPMLVSLATGVAEPAARLAAIAGSARRAKEQEKEVSAAILGDWAEVVAPGLLAGAARLAHRWQAAERVKPSFNLVISNVAGPPRPLYLAGAPLEAVYPLGPVLDGAALNITVFSYTGRLGFGLIADRAAVPGLRAIAEGLLVALDDLVRASTCRGPIPPEPGTGSTG